MNCRILGKGKGATYVRSKDQFFKGLRPVKDDNVKRYRRPMTEEEWDELVKKAKGTKGRMFDEELT
jgi:hypothetical protein